MGGSSKRKHSDKDEEEKKKKKKNKSDKKSKKDKKHSKKKDSKKKTKTDKSKNKKSEKDREHKDKKQKKEEPTNFYDNFAENNKKQMEAAKPKPISFPQVLAKRSNPRQKGWVVKEVIYQAKRSVPNAATPPIPDLNPKQVSGLLLEHVTSKQELFQHCVLLSKEEGEEEKYRALTDAEERTLLQQTKFANGARLMTGEKNNILNLELVEAYHNRLPGFGYAARNPIFQRLGFCSDRFLLRTLKKSDFEVKPFSEDKPLLKEQESYIPTHLFYLGGGLPPVQQDALESSDSNDASEEGKGSGSSDEGKDGDESSIDSGDDEDDDDDDDEEEEDEAEAEAEDKESKSVHSDEAETKPESGSSARAVEIIDTHQNLSKLLSSLRVVDKPQSVIATIKKTDAALREEDFAAERITVKKTPSVVTTPQTPAMPTSNTAAATKRKLSNDVEPVTAPATTVSNSGNKRQKSPAVTRFSNLTTLEIIRDVQKKVNDMAQKNKGERPKNFIMKFEGEEVFFTSSCTEAQMLNMPDSIALALPLLLELRAEEKKTGLLSAAYVELVQPQEQVLLDWFRQSCLETQNWDELEKLYLAAKTQRDQQQQRKTNSDNGKESHTVIEWLDRQLDPATHLIPLLKRIYNTPPLQIGSRVLDLEAYKRKFSEKIDYDLLPNTQSMLCAILLHWYELYQSAVRAPPVAAEQEEEPPVEEDFDPFS